MRPSLALTKPKGPKTPVRIDRDFLRRLRVELDRVLSHLAPEFNGVKVSIAPGGSYDAAGTNATLKLSVATIGVGGEVITKEAASFKSLATFYGLKPTDLGRQFSVNGERVKIVGLMPKSHKYPILVECSDGRKMKYPAETTVALLAKEPS